MRSEDCCSSFRNNNCFQLPWTTVSCDDCLAHEDEDKAKWRSDQRYSQSVSRYFSRSALFQMTLNLCNAFAVIFPLLLHHQRRVFFMHTAQRLQNLLSEILIILCNISFTFNA